MNDLLLVDRTWIEKRPIELEMGDISNFVNEDFGRFIVKDNGTNFHCLFLNNKANSGKLIVSLGGGGRKKNNYPCFYRWKYLNCFTGDYLAIDDPSYEKYKDIQHVCWYYGRDGSEYYLSISKIIESVLRSKRLKEKDLIFIGSSGGGSAAIKLANIFSGSTAIAFSPQFKYCKWSEKITAWFKKQNINLMDTEIAGLNVDCLNLESKYFIVENICSRRDFNTQYKYFLEKHKFSLDVGISKITENVWLWNHKTEVINLDPHVANPERLEIILIQAILSGDLSLPFILGKCNLGWLFSELLSEKWRLKDSIAELNRDICDDNRFVSLEFLKNIVKSLCEKYQFLCNSAVDKDRPRIKVFIKDIPEINHYEISEINGVMWIRLIARRPCLDLKKKFETFKNGKNGIYYTDRELVENFIYLKKKLSPWNIGKDIDFFINQTSILFRKNIDIRNKIEETS